MYLNDGKGSLALAGSLALRNDVLQLALGDVDGDGSLDVVSTSRAGVDFMLHRPR